MPGQTEVNVTLAMAPSNDPQKSFPFVLKKIMDIPPPNILDDGDDGKGFWNVLVFGLLLNPRISSACLFVWTKNKKHQC